MAPLFRRDLLRSGAVTNLRVRRAERALARWLRRRGAAKVSIVRLRPGADGAKVGLDDYLLTHSVKELDTLPRLDANELPLGDAVEMLTPETDPAVHVAAIRSRADWIPGLIDSTANGRNQADGQRLIQMYRKFGLDLSSMDNPIESGILNVWQRMHSGRLKVFASLSKYLDERRLYRRDERGQIVKDRDHLQDALRCLVSGVSRMRTKPQPAPAGPCRVFRGSNSWMR